MFLVDAIQGLGAFPVDVCKAHIDFLSADGHKWLLGPEGCGIFYIRKGVQDQVEPVEFGWTNVARYADYASRDMTLRPDAGRFECGTLNTIGCFGLRAAINFLLEVGVGEIAPVVQNLGDRIAAGVEAKGYQVLGKRTPETGAGIVSFRKPGVAAGDIVRQLRAAHISAAPRAGWVRTSPHFYISPGEIGRMLEVLP
jgi:selenocysteine lyase/cysteine desulfurase